MHATPPADASAARLPLRPDLRGLEPYGAPHPDVDITINVNENPYPPPTAVIESIAAAITATGAQLNRYPDRDFTALREGLANYLTIESLPHLSHGALSADNIWAGNGSNEVMLHLLQAFAGAGRTVVSCTPTYSMYPEYARDTQSTYVEVPRKADFTVDVDATITALEHHRPAALLLASPNNPSGTALSATDITQITAAAATTGPVDDRGETATVVIVDEAYGEFRRSGTASALELLADFPHLVVCRTMSKAFAMAGLRLGYLAAAPQLIDHLRVVRLPYHLSAITQAAALAALDHREQLLAQVSHLRHSRDILVTWLTDQGLDVAESDANFVMFGKFTDRHAVWQGLLDRGILIREVGPHGWLRVSVGTDEENARFTSALQEVLS